MTDTEKAKNLEAWARYFKHNPKRAAHYQCLADEQRGHVPPDTRKACAHPFCREPATADATVCAAHYADGVL